MEKERQLIYFKNHYKDFFDLQNERVKDKIDYVLYLVTIAAEFRKSFFNI